MRLGPKESHEQQQAGLSFLNDIRFALLVPV